MATTGRMPCAANPPAKVTACCSAMPTSYNRSGNSFSNAVRPVPSHIAEAQLLEQQSLEDDALGQFLRPVGDLRDRLTDAGDGAQELPGLLLDAGVKLPGEGPVQVGRDGAHVL